MQRGLQLVGRKSGKPAPRIVVITATFCAIRLQLERLEKLIDDWIAESRPPDAA